MKITLILFAWSAALVLGAAIADPVNIPDLEARAAKGDPEAELDLGRAYHVGNQGVPKDFAKAADLYRKAAAQGNAKAMYNLGYIYYHAQGVPQDVATAAQWFQKAADKGLPAAELEVGLAYFAGDTGQKQDLNAAAKWLLLAAQQTSKPAEKAEAANCLGLLYEQGAGVPQNIPSALDWFKEGADLGNAKARYNLGRIYMEGGPVKKDPVLSYMWLKMAAFQAEPMSMHLLTENLAAKAYTPEQMAEGDQKLKEYKAQHPLTTPNITGAAPRVIEPGIPGDIPTPGAPSAAGAQGSGTTTPARSPAGSAEATPKGP